MNNREIKFRAWIKEDKEMIFSPLVTTQDLADEAMPLFWSRLEDNTIYQGDVVLMQYTGLKDKNGKEIYEGDFLKLHAYDKPQGVVEYHRGAYRFHVNKFVDYAGNVHEYSWCDVGAYSSKDLEILGNIYENPKLIKD